MKLIERIRQFWRYWHVRIAALAAVAAGAIVSEPTILTGLVTYVPQQWRPAAGAAVGLIVFALPTWVKRHVRAEAND